MKKKMALLLATVMATAPLSALNVSVSAAEVTDIYADVYGIEVEFGEVPAPADIADLALTKVDGGEVVTVAWAEGETDTKYKIVPEQNLEVDEAYTLSFGTTEKDFKIKTVFFEDFEDSTAYATQDVSDTTPFEHTNAYGDIEVSYGTKGAFIKDGKVWVTNGALKISNVDTFDDLSDTTIMADVAGYAKYYPFAGTILTIAQNQVMVHMLSRAQSSNASASGIKLKRETFGVGTTNESGTYIESAASSVYPQETQADGATNTRFDYGKIADPGLANRVDTVSTQTVIVDGTNGIESNERNVALRTNGKSITAFVDTASTTYADDAISTTAGDYVLGLTTNASGIAVFDNVRITAYTEDIEEITGDLEALTLEDVNYEKLVLTFNKRLRDLGPQTVSSLQILKDGTDITSTTAITVDPEDDTKLNIIPEGYSAGYTYEVVVPQNFGKGTLLTTEEKTFSVYVEATPIAYTGHEFTPEGIEITFDTDLTDITDADDLSSVEVEIGDANSQNFVADSSAVVTKNGAILKVTPSDYAVGKSYKITIPAGFGNANTYLHQEEVIEDLFQRIPVDIKKIDGNDCIVDIEFTEPIDKNDPTLSVSGITICEVTKNEGDDYYTTSDPKTNTPSVTDDGKLHIDFPGMEPEKTYEIYIPATFGTDTVGLAHDIRKKFTFTTVAFENYDSDGQSFGNVGQGFTKSLDKDGTNYRGYCYGGYYNLISNDELAAAENFTMEFDFQMFFAVKLINHPSFSDEYDAPTRSAHKMSFNKQGAPQTSWVASEEDHIAFTIRESKAGYVERIDKINSPTEYANFTYTVNGDAIKKDSGEFYVYNVGETFDEELSFETVAGQTVAQSQRAIQPARHYKIVKTGANFTIYRENENGQMVQLFNKVAAAGAPTKGLIEYGGDAHSIDTFDNIRFRRIKVIEEEDVAAADLAITTTGDLSAQATLEGTFSLKNYTNSSKDIYAIVASYNANGSMLCADLDATTSIAPGQELNLDFDLINSTGTTSIKLFLWDSLTSRSQIGVYDFPITSTP